MKFTSYEPAVSPGIMNPPPVQAPHDINVFGGNGRGLMGMAQGIGAIAGAAQKQQDENDAAAVMGARNEIMTKLTSGLYGEDGLLTNGVGENAQGLTGRVTDYIKKSSAEVMAKQNGRVQRALLGNLSENFSNFQRVAASQERSEKHKVDDANYTGNIEQCSQNAALYYDKDGFVDSQINQALSLTAAYGKLRGFSGAMMATANRKAVTDAAGAAASAAIDAGDYESAGKILTKYRTGMEPDTYGRMESLVKKKQEAKTTDSTVQDIISKCRRPDGSIDLSAANAAVDAINGQGAVKRSSGIEAVRSAGEGFIGQTMDNGREGCAEAATKIGASFSPFLKQEFDAGVTWVPQLVKDAGAGNVEAYDAAKVKAGDCIVYRRGADGDMDHVTVADGNGGFYGNSSNADGPNGDGHVIHQQGGVDIDGLVPQYIIHTGGSGEEKSAYDPEANERMKRMIHAQYENDRAAQAQQRQDYIKAVGESAQGAGNYAAAVGVIEGAGLSMEEANRLEGQARSFYHVTPSGGQRNSGGNGGGSGSSGRGSKDGSTYLKTLSTFNLSLTRDENPTASEWIGAKMAAQKFVDGGFIGEDAAEELSAYEGDPEVYSLITDMANSGQGPKDIRDALIDNGADPTVALILVTQLDESYMK